MNTTYGIDWLSATTKNDETGQEWWERYCQWTRDKGRLFEETFTLQGGYQGFVNEYFTWAYSRSLQSYFVQGTGNNAGDIWGILSGSRDIRYTRIDLRVDISDIEVMADLAGKAYDDNKGSQKPTYRLIDKSGEGGQTLYIGSTSSDRFARLYDKSAERGMGVGRWWRYEVVTRKPHADKLAEQITSMGVNAIPSIVWAWFNERNVRPVFDAASVAAWQAEREEKPASAKIEWLRKSVSSTVSKLIQAGLEKEVLEALGLAELRR